MNETVMKNEFESAMAAGAAAVDARYLANGKQSFAIVPKGYEAVDLERFQAHPTRARIVVLFKDTASFIRYVLDFKTPETRIFCTITETSCSMAAIIDYHGKEAAAWCAHRVNLGFDPSPEWKRWSQKNSTAFGQSEFAQFLEENLPDIVDPVGAKILEVALSLESKKSVNFKSAVRLDNGDVEFAHQEASDGALQVPTKFTVALAPFMHGPKWKVEARLRYRVQEGKLTFWYELVRPHLVIQEACTEVINQIVEKTGIEPLIGTP
jgi:uncharacterized protein YfdQ (DUF2303 family)